MKMMHDPINIRSPKYLFIITNTMHTIGVDKITLFKTSVYDESILKGDEYTDDA